MNGKRVVGLALLAAAAAGAWIDAKVFLAAWLAAWWWCLGLVLGVFVNAWMHRLTGGAWGLAFRALAPGLGRRALWLLPLFLPLAFGVSTLYPWAGTAPTAWTAGMAQPAFARAWLSPAFFFARLVFYALVWWRLTRERSLDNKGRAAVSLLVHAAVSSLAAVDLLMSLMPGWYSTAFGLIALSTQALAGAALTVLWGTRAARAMKPAAGMPPVCRDWGNLLLMWTMTWGYLAFMEFLIIWAENLPREIAWYVPRLHTGWRGVGLALVALQLALPFVALLWRAVKDDPQRLAAVACGLLAASAVDVAWLVLPSVAPHSLHAWWLLPLTFAGMGLVLLGDLPQPAAHGVQGRQEGWAHARP